MLLISLALDPSAGVNDMLVSASHWLSPGPECCGEYIWMGTRLPGKTLMDPTCMCTLLCGAGVNNDFLVKTLSPLALTYNDRSPLVRWSLGLLSRGKECLHGLLHP